MTAPRITFGDIGWRSLFHDDCPQSRGGIVAPLRGEPHVLPDGSRLARWRCMHCGVEFFAGLDARRFVTVVAASEVTP